MRRALLVLVAGAFALALPCPSCREAEPVRDPEVVMVVDGIEVRRAELDAYLDYAREMEPERGTQSIRQVVLADVILPTALARRWYGAEMEEALRRAADVARLSRPEGSPALLRYGGVEHGEPVGRADLVLPVARAAFSLAEGEVSEPIVHSSGVTVVGVLARMPGNAPLQDLVELCYVDFPLTDDPDHRRRVLAGVQDLKGLVTWVHPDFEDAIPIFLRADS